MTAIYNIISVTTVECITPVNVHYFHKLHTALQNTASMPMNTSIYTEQLFKYRRKENQEIDAVSAQPSTFLIDRIFSFLHHLVLEPGRRLLKLSRHSVLQNDSGAAGRNALRYITGASPCHILHFLSCACIVARAQLPARLQDRKPRHRNQIFGKGCKIMAFAGNNSYR